jgi:hypothetical protein
MDSEEIPKCTCLHDMNVVRSSEISSTCKGAVLSEGKTVKEFITVVLEYLATMGEVILRL